MTDSRAPLLVISDAHFGYDDALTSRIRLAKLAEQHPGHELVLAGDIFNLSVDPPGRNPAESVRALVERSPELVQALGRHLRDGHAVTLLAGNHDAGVLTHGTREALLDLLAVNGAARLSIEAWFIRRGDVHVEHGHVYDPDNAPAHPLAMSKPETEPLGVALTRRFVAPNDAFAFSHAHETTPVAGLTRAYREFGARTPLMVLLYLVASGRMTLEAAVPERLGAERARGAREVEAFAARTGLTPARIEELLESLPKPTHAQFREIFFRLYFDRLLTAAGVGVGALGLLFGSVAGGALAAGSAAYLFRSLKRGVNRYSNLPVQRLHAGAELVRRATDAKLVVFGHTHCEDEAPGYLNSASFAYTHRRGSPYLRIAYDGTAERREVTA